MCKRLSLVIAFLALFFLIEPLAPKLTFALNYLDRPVTRNVNDRINSVILQEPPHSIPVQKSHAPEPSSLLLFFSGIAGMFVRFVKTSFDKFKRALDFVLATIGLLIVSPIVIFVAILIKITSKGPVFYRQKRVGQNGNIFRIYKLRTMVIDAEKNTGAIWAKKDDHRITSVGRVLRNTHIDEIPQLFNVLAGEMSIVGPRPERPEMVRDLKVLIRDYEKRLQVKPGITGMAQILHKYDENIEDVKKKIKYDLFYIKKMDLAVDLNIMARTFTVVLTGKGAR